jgi:hypothetical protein
MDSINSPVTLANGYQMPCVGYGTYQTPADETRTAVAEAIKLGYRHIDTAAIYGNEAGVGEAIVESGLDREEFFLTTKLWNTERGYDSTLAAFETSLNTLGLDYVDLYLIHWPANYLQFGDDAKRINAETWRAFEDLYEQGRVKAIGVSNFLPHHLEALAETARIMPMVDQVEFHPGWFQRSIYRYCQDKGIVLQAWSPLGQRAALDNPELVSIGAKHGKTSAQVCLRWTLQHGVVPLPKTVTPARMVENADLFDFELSGADMELIDNLSISGGPSARPDEALF